MHAKLIAGKTAHAGSRTRVTSMGGLYDAATLRALLNADWPFVQKVWRMSQVLLFLRVRLCLSSERAWNGFVVCKPKWQC